VLCVLCMLCVACARALVHIHSVQGDAMATYVEARSVLANPVGE
jgi:hypothetical protein